MNPIKFFKYHGLGNDYIVLNPADLTITLTPQQITRICHRNFGIGSDGILLGPLAVSYTHLTLPTILLV